MGLIYPISVGFLMIRIQNMCGKAILMRLMCLIPILVGLVHVYGGFICSTTPFKGLAPINEVKEVLIHKSFNTKNALHMANSAGPDETPRFIWIFAICKCSTFFINALTTSPQLRTLIFRQATPLAMVRF